MDQPTSMLEDLCRDVSRRAGAARTWVVAGRAEHLEGLFPTARVVRVLGGVPVRCADLRVLAACGGAPIVADVTTVSSWGCAAVRLGAAVAVESLDRVLRWQGSGLLAVSVARDLPEALRPLTRSLALQRSLPDRLVRDLARGMASFDERRRRANDNAQVLASYLRCHPQVVEVRYPGLREDATYEVAARTLSGGFGAVVDARLASPRPDLAGRVLAGGGSPWAPGGASSRLDVVAGDDGSPWLRVTCGTGDPYELAEAAERALLVRN